jgi:hypothetical protein
MADVEAGVVAAEESPAVESPAAEPKPEPKPEPQMEVKAEAPRSVGFDVEDSDAKGAHAPRTEEVDDIKAASQKGRQTTFQKMRQTLKEGAEEVGTAVSDATSFTLATTVEHIVVATARFIRKENNWNGPAGLGMAEAFVLLWTDKSGEIAGRKNSATLQAICYGCLLVDLIAIGKLDVQKFNKKIGPMAWERHIISPTGPEALNNYMDPVFQSVKENYDKGERRTIAKWVEVVATSEEGTETIDDVVYSLSDKDILKLEKKKALLGETFKAPPTASGQIVIDELIGALRKVLLDGEEAPPFIRSLLRWIHEADRDFVMRSPFISKVLKTSVEKQRAAAVLKTIAKLDGEK